MDLGLKGKTAIITGGTAGIGKGCSTCLAREGCNVIMIYRSEPDKAKELEEQLSKEYGVIAKAYQYDISSPENVTKCYEEIFRDFDSVDILVNNAAGGVPKGKYIEEITYEEWTKGMDGCLNLILTMSQPFIKHCKENQKEGHIINFSAKQAFRSSTTKSLTYSTAKGAIGTMTTRMANELIDFNIFVNCVVPGYVWSKMRGNLPPEANEKKAKLLRIGWASNEDMGNIVAFLASPMSKQIIGAVIDASGGTMF